MTEQLEHASFDDLVARARRLLDRGSRTILGITGAPGAGKTTVGTTVTEALGDDAALVGLDGFHLADQELHRMGLHATKGALDTFDGYGYVAALERLHAGDDSVVYVPRFDRALEAAIAGAIGVRRETPLVVTEGNYLLVDAPPWDRVRPLLDECWYVDIGDDVRLARLVRRHEAYGRSPAEARARSYGSDQRNADLIASARGRADLVIAVRSYGDLGPRT